MKACKLYVDKSYLAEKLGIEESQFAIGKVESNLSEIEFTILIDEDAITKELKTVRLANNDLLIRRNKI